MELTARSAPEQIYSAPSNQPDRKIADLLPQLVWTCTDDGKCDYLSRQWVEYTGIPEHEQLEFGWLLQVHPEDHDRVIATWNQSAATGTNLDVEFRIRRFDGAYRWFKTRAVPLRDADNQIARWFGSNTDIEDLKLAESAVRESEELFRVTFEQAAVGIAHVGPEGRFLRVNPKLCAILGYTAEELLQFTFSDITWPDDLPLHPPKVTDLMEGKTDNIHIEKRYRHKNGGPVWVKVTSSLRRYEDGSPRYFISMMEDISARKRAEAALRLLARAGETLGSTLDADVTVRELMDLILPDWADWASVQYIDETETGTHIRNVAMRHVDPRKDAIGLELVGRFADDPVATGPFLATLRQGKPLLIVAPGPDYMVAPNADPNFVHLIRSMGIQSVVIMPLLSRTEQDKQGYPRLLGAFACHITESKRHYDEQDLALFDEIGRRVASAIDRANLYAEAQMARKTAENANRAKDEFLSIVSHELRTPLTPVIGWISLLRNPLNENQKNEALDVIERNLQLQVQIVDDILDTSRITSGKLNITKKVLSLTPLVRESLEAVHNQAKDKNVAIFVSLPPGDVFVYGDGLRLRQIIWNLLTNALKFTPPGGRIELQMRCGETASHVEIIVRDTGIGIEAEFLPHIFERFRQADSSHTRHHGGLGLGLSIVRHLTTMHDGTVQANSAGKNQGATFTVCLPRCEVK